MELRGFSICHDCISLLRHRPPTARPSIFRAAVGARSSRSLTTAQTPFQERRTRACRPQSTKSQAVRSVSIQKSTPKVSSQATIDLNGIHARVQELAASALKSENGQPPSEQRVLYVLEQLSYSAHLVLSDKEGGLARDKPETEQSRQQTATSALLGSVNTRRYPAFISRTSVLDNISERAEEIVRHPDVFITAAVLKAYIELQSLLSQPSSFPDVFELYARKPIPKPGKHETQYAPASPDTINSAIDSNTAKTALACAMQSHNLTLSLDIIITSFCTTAFKKSKLFRQAGVPIGGLAIAPLAAWTLSSQFSQLQQTMDPATATGIAFAGIMTYVGAVSMVGYVAVTTANDQMDRVTWAGGVPLWERWIREDERAAIDKVAGAWGFKNVEKRGDEEGADWEYLKEWVGSRGMILDRVSLMDGME